MTISVFKTSIQEKDLTRISMLLKGFKELSRWNTDLQDCDNILRIESNSDIANKIIRILGKQGFYCEELKD